PNFLQYQAKSKQSEARVLLSGLYTSQIAFFAETNIYGNWTMALGVVNDANNIGFLPASTPKYYQDVAFAVSSTGGFVQTATGDIDGEIATIDTWTVSDLSREPCNGINDVTNTVAAAGVCKV
ncbi:MAG: hypothetical protein OEW11_10210, partial [Nitrospirota bacterium]|nr:hypothetical protein [Nitrospirota bacterium]